MRSAGEGSGFNERQITVIGHRRSVDAVQETDELPSTRTVTVTGVLKWR